MNRVKKGLFSLGVLALLMMPVLALLNAPVRADFETPRQCDNWYFTDGSQFRFSHCTNPYIINGSTAAKAHARLHLYQWNGSSWVTPSSVDSITINDWGLTTDRGIFPRSPQSRGSGPAYADFYSAGVGICLSGQASEPVTSHNWDESVRLANGHAHYGPNNSSESVSSTYVAACPF
jgi:hypothetical protein